MATVMRSASGSTPMHQIEAAKPVERYARGWHCLGLASDYRDGKPHSLGVFGTRLVVFPDQEGQLKGLTAWCPHMGADLGLGELKDGTVACRFHGWQWGGDGGCKHIPYAKRIPPKARIQTWQTMEDNGLLFVWNDPEGNPPPPEVTIPRMEQAFSDEWSDWSIVKWTINNNCRELIDNQSDLAHFETVHGPFKLVYFANLFDGHKVSQVMMGANERLGGGKLLKTVATYFGPAYHITHMKGESQGVPIESILLNTHVPIDQNSFELRFGVIVKKIPGLSEEQNKEMIQAYVEASCQAFGEDVEIWHNKVRIDNPLLCDGDGPIYQLRQWYEQFYVDAEQIPAAQQQRRIIENDLGVGDEKPPVTHVFE